MKRPCYPVILLSFSLLLSISRICPAEDNPGGSLQPGDLVGICGDSITEQKIYSAIIAEYLLMCQPQPKLGAVQFGWGGERAPTFLGRMKNDALVFKPTVATTCYGMNDGGYTATTKPILDTYRASMTGIVDTLKANGVRFIVVGTPGAVDTYFYKRTPTAEVYNHTLADLGQVAKEVAQKEGVGFADVHDAMIDVMTKAKAKNGQDFCVSGPDGVHPLPAGHLIMAYAFLKGLGCDGNIGTITVDMKAGTADATDGTKVVSYASGALQLESTRYPFCFAAGSGDKDAHSTRSILPFLPFNQDLNRYLLVVKNPSAKSLKITWGKESKTFSAEELAKGVNLAAEFLDNPFVAPFQAVQEKVDAQQAFETMASKQLLHSIPDWDKALPDAADLFAQLPPKIMARWESLREASSAAVVPVQHEIKIEVAP